MKIINIYNPTSFFTSLLFLSILSLLSPLALTKSSYIAISDPNSAPFQFLDDQGNLIGAEVDLLNAIAKDQNISIEFKAQLWDTIFDELANEKADIIVNGIASTDIEENNIIVTNGYLFSPNCLAYTKAELFDDWQNHRIQIVDDSALQKNISDKFGVSNFETIDYSFVGMRNLAADRSDFFAADCSRIRYYSKSPTFARHNIKFYIHELDEGHDSLEGLEIIIAVNENNQELLNKLNTGLANLKQNGTLDEILKKWNLN